MKKKQLWTAGLFALSLVTGCSNENGIVEGQSPEQEARQSFTIRVESVGESYINKDATEKSPMTRRPITSVTPAQTFDKLELVIMRNDGSAEVVYRKSLEGWSDTDNFTSRPYTDGSKLGREAIVELTGDNLLEDGEDYMVYAIGYQTGTYGGYVPFKDVQVGKPFTRTETATVPEGGYADEIFAGAEYLHVTDGKIMTRPTSESEPVPGVVTLRRQVAGTFGYFTHIPTKVNGKKTATLRLVATRRNKTVIFGGFRGIEDPENFNQENVINGMTPRTDYDARLAGSSKNDAFIVYDIQLSKWFPGGENALPLDQNGDGYLDMGDTNWRLDSETYPGGSLKIQRGSVFSDCFWIAAAVTKNEIARHYPTFQMQVLDASGEILKSWDVLLREKIALQKTRTVVTLDEAGGQAVVTTEANPENEHCYSIVRNHLYTMGTKSHGQSYGEDEPIDLAAADDLVLDVNNEWENGNTVIFH